MSATKLAELQTQHNRIVVERAESALVVANEMLQQIVKGKSFDSMACLEALRKIEHASVTFSQARVSIVKAILR